MRKITLTDVIKRSKNLQKADTKLIRKAYEFAKVAHKGQKRKTGEAFINHPLYTAYYIAGLGLGGESIAAALLHDVIEDCGVSENKIKKEFNPTIARLVMGVTKLKGTGTKKITQSSVENLRRFFLVAAKDIRAVIIKLADRLHNARTIHGLAPDKQKKYAKEIKYIYSPLSDYLGVAFFRRNFDDIAFKILKPEEYKRIRHYLQKRHRKRRRYVYKIKRKIEAILKEHKIKGEVQGRDKNIYSLYKKLQRYIQEGKIHSKTEYGRVYDYYGFRIMVNSKEDCYKVLGLIHSEWHPLNGQFNDYIANPKPNGYKSLHTTVFCDKEKIAEIQIRTYEMHDYNEFGPASHIAYKRSNKGKSFPTLAYNWLRRISIFNRGEIEKLSAKDYQVQVFKDNIFVLTPANEVKKLPKGATPVDFAYAVHTEVGNRCRGAKVNDKMVPLDYELHTGDQVEILIDKGAQYPIPKWLEFVASVGTRSKIKYALRHKEEKEAAEKGYKKLNKALKKFNTTFNKIYDKRRPQFDLILYKHHANDTENLFARIGFGLVSVESVISSLFPKKMKKKSSPIKKGNVIIEGSKNTQYTKAQCCDPAVGDPIVAFTTLTRGIRIHKSNCPYIQNRPEKRILEAHWE